MKTRILIIEDDANIALGLTELLKSEGYECRALLTGDEALPAIQSEKPDLLVLDIMLPGKSGYEICRELRDGGSTLPVLMLTAKGEELDKVLGLKLGADDYVTKPFGLQEFLARVQALLRRATRQSSTPKSFTIGDCEIDSTRFELRCGRRVESLSAKELQLLTLFWKRPGEVLSRDNLLTEVWGYTYGGTTRTLDQTIVQLRKKLGDADPNRRILVSVHGVGYKLDVPN